MPQTPLKRIVLYSCLFCCIVLSKVSAQETPSSIPLITMLQSLEKVHEIKFSFVDKDLANIKVTKPETTALLEIFLSLESQTQLQIKKISDRYYALIKTPNISICAYVYDNFEQNTVMGTSIEVLNSDISLITDMDGYFTLKDVPRDAVLRIKHNGYKTLFVTAEELLGQTECETILLAEYYHQLQEVVVYEFLTSGLSKQADASIELNIEKFGILPGAIEPDILQTIQALPGIKSIDETVSNINIRGGSNDQNLLLWDGIKMYQSGHFFGLISAFNPYLTEKVTLIKNGTSSEYGDGVSGLITMQTKDDSKQTFFGGAGFNLISGDIFGQMPLSKKLGIQFSARRSMTDFLSTPTFSRFFSRVFNNDQIVNVSAPQNTNRDEKFYFYDFSGKVLYDINDKQQLRFNFISIYNQLEYTEEEITTGERTQSNLNQSNISVGAKLNSQWTSRFSTSLNAYYTSYVLGSLNISFDQAQQLLQNNQVQESSVKLNTNLQLGEQLNLLNGIQVSETDIINKTNVSLPPFENNVRGMIATSAFFSELAYRSPENKLSAKAGVRLNNYRNPNNFSKFLVEPRLNINYTFAKNLKLIVLGEFKSQATNQVVDLEQNFLGIEKRRWVISDGLNLPVTRSKQGSVGINYEKKNIFIGLEGFYKEVNDISTATQGFQNQFQFNGEIGQYDVKGIEFLINKKTDDYSVWGSYTYNLNRYNFPDFTPSSFPNNFDIRHTVTLAGTYTKGDFKFGLGLNYRSGMPFTEPDAINPIDTSIFPSRIIFGSPNSSRLPEYIRADASAVYDFKLSSKIKASAGISVLNFTSRKNILNAYYQLGDADTIERVENVSLGLTPNFSFRVKF